jgi:ribosomal protein L2
VTRVVGVSRFNAAAFIALLAYADGEKTYIIAQTD